ncbi:baseplate assembly protein [Psychrobacter urativorans]|uniref:Baseplate assembly protein n=1 Tax=Psychrobacter urativorans TaxID=45610 RepID=A0A0M3V9B1_9GAMM|nr:baseplate J/gp47 family protein [Psychrobacter urativorans]ALF60327.1 baseplate assembly protein [Psychrobacter urativorans]
MNNVFTAINLQGLPPPNLIAPIAPEAELLEIRTEFAAKFPANHPIHAALALESEPVNKILEVLAYRYSLKVSEINRTARSLMLAYATNADLDHIGVTYYRVERKVLQLEDLTTNPVTPEILEDDSDYRDRLALSVEAETKAGSAGAYLFHALSASSQVFNATVHSPAPTEVDVYLSGQIEGDVLDQATKTVGVDQVAIDDVTRALTADDVRPMTDLVRVHSATAKAYEINAVIYIKAGISPQLILAQGLADLRAYLRTEFKPGRRIATSRIIGALDVNGVSRIELISPASDVLVDVSQVAHCTSYDITAVSSND